jgi:hypothetical protein
MTFPAVTPISYASSSGSLSGLEDDSSFDAAADAANGSAFSAPGTTPATTDPLQQQYDTLKRQEAKLQGEVNALQLQYDQESSSANVSWSMSQVFKGQEDAEKDDARENEEQASTVSMSGVMSTNSRQYREDAMATAKKLDTAKTELSSVQGQISQVQAQIDAQQKPS